MTLTGYSQESSSGSKQQDRYCDYELNPEGEWQMLAKSTIKMVIELLEKGYKETKEH